MSSLRRIFSPIAILATAGVAIMVSGCDRPAAYDTVQGLAYKDTEAPDATPETVLDELLRLTDISLDTAERKTMLAHLSEKSPNRRRMILSHLKTANGRSMSSGNWKGRYYRDAEKLSYPIPDGVSKVQYLQQLMTTSTAGATPGG